MDRSIKIRSVKLIPVLLRFQWRAYWRALRRGGKLTAGNQGLSLIILGIVTLKYVQSLRIAAVDVTRGKTMLLESLMAGIWVAWSIATNSSREQRTIASREWLHLPLSLKELFAVRVTSLLIPPSAWIIVLGSAATCYPLAFASHRAAGFAAVALFVAMAVLLGLTASHLLSIPVWRRVLSIAAVVLGAASVLFFMRRDPHGQAEDVMLFPFTPMSLVVRAAIGKQAGFTLLVLAILTSLSLVAAVWSFRASLAGASPRGARKARRSTRLRLPGRFGGLVAKDARYFWRLLDTYLGLLAAAAGCFYLLTAENPALDLLLIFLALIFIPISPLAFNSFGLDTATGLDRYLLFPLTGREILLSKNLAFLLVTGLLATPLIMLASWQLGIVASAVGVVTFGSLASAGLAWGNWMSLSHPKKMLFFHFSSSSASIFDALAGVVFLSSPGVLIIYLVHSRFYSALNLALILALFGVLYFFSLTFFGKRFEKKRDNIARALS